jgi:hypothetical protein
MPSVGIRIVSKWQLWKLGLLICKECFTTNDNNMKLVSETYIVHLDLKKWDTPKKMDTIFLVF